MERFSQRQNFLLGYAAQRSFEGPSSLPNVDFNDVFGGPPRRFSLQESTRYSSDGSMDSDETALFRRLSSEKPVFGEESSSSSSSGVNRRKHHQGSDFFDDIFQGDKSCSSPRRDFLNSLPGLQIMSPSRPLPPKSEPFGSSVPAQFSLPSTLNKAMNYPTFGSSSSFKQKEVTSNGISSPNSSLSRFSNQPMQGNDDFRNDVFPSNRPSHLSNEFSNAESSNVTKSNETDMRGNSKGDAKVTEVPTDINQFHFSIYKWAGEGISSNSSKIKNDKLKRCSSSNGRIISDKANETEKNHNISVNFVSSKMEREKVDKTSTLKREETCHIVEEDVLIKPKPEVLETAQVTVENFPDNVMLSSRSEERKTSSPPEISLSEKTEKKISMVKEEARKPDLKSLRSILQDEIDRLDNEDIIMKGERKQNVAKTTKASLSNAAGSKNVKKHEGKRINSDRVEASNIPGLPKIPGGNLKKSGVRGKVKDFAKIFNQETYSKSKSCRWEGKVNEASVDTTEMNFLDMNEMPDSFFMVNENVEKPEKHHSHMNSKIHTSTDNSYNQNDASQFSESIPDGSKVTSDNINDPFQENYLTQDLSDDQVKLPQTGEDLEATKALDAKILKWSTGKIGNIRSLLSTLQYVLWAESGWNPVPLVDIIEGNAVKRGYQKALLCLHPDKLQQKGAASHQKYIAEKVFDILQEAWDHFNSLGSI